MAELAGIAEAFAKFGAWGIVALLVLVVRSLYRDMRISEAARLSDMRDFLTTGIKAQEASSHALDKLEEVIRGLKP